MITISIRVDLALNNWKAVTVDRYKVFQGDGNGSGIRSSDSCTSCKYTKTH